MTPEPEDRLDDEIAEALRDLDHPVPFVDVDALMRRAERGGRTAWTWIAAAAAVALVVTGAVAWPGSPIRGWLAAHQPGAASAPGPDGRHPPSDSSGLAVVPNADFDVEFTTRQTAGGVRIQLTNGDAVQVRTQGPPVPYELEPARAVVRNAGSNAIHVVALPTTPHRLRVVVAGTVVLTTERGVVSSSLPREEGGWALWFDGGVTSKPFDTEERP